MQVGHEPGREASRLHMSAIVYNLNTDLSRVSIHKSTFINQRFLSPRFVDFSEMQLELKRLVSAWFESGPNLSKMFDQDPDLKRRTMHGRTLLIPTTTGRGHLCWLPDLPDEDLTSQKDLALTHFMNLIANPDWELLGGPCARCRKYYLKKTKRQKVYCSRTCSSASTAIPAMKIKRQHEHAEKISCTQEYIHKWGEAKRRVGWKNWVSDKTGFTVKWLTQMVNSKQLSPPGSTGTRVH